MKITKTQLKQFIKEELVKEISFGSFMKDQDLGDDSPPVGEIPMSSSRAQRGRFDTFFEEGAPGDVFAEAVAKDLWLDDESDFDAMVQAIRGGLENWYSAKRAK